MAVSMISSMPAASSIFSMYASVSAFFMLLQTMVNGLVPLHVQQYLLDLLRRYFAPKATTSTAVVMIEEQAGMSVNEMYTAAETYLSSQRRPEIRRLKISKARKDPGLTVRFADFDKIVDSHRGIKLEWRFVQEEQRENATSGEISGNGNSEKKYFELSFDIKFRDEVLDSYLPWIIERAQTIKAARKRVVKLHTLSSAGNPRFDSINLEHPSTFETLAMEPEMKKKIVDDLDRFVRRKDFYRRVGKAWKRGYLLYGPPGTGKSSLIAAMANYLKFDIYDLELTNVYSDSALRQLLLRTANRSILVIEDIDCTVELPSRMPGGGYYPRRNQKFSLSGLLNFIDGLWSSCGDERIIIFTTNNKDKLEPALLRPGRMDVHIHMSYLTAEGFKTLASTYLDVPGHYPRFSEIGDLIKGKNITPAEIAEELMKCDDVDSCLDGIVHFIENKTNNNNNNDDNSKVGNAEMEDINAKQGVDDDDDNRNHDDDYENDDYDDDQLYNDYHGGDDDYNGYDYRNHDDDYDDDDDEQLFHY